MAARFLSPVPLPNGGGGAPLPPPLAKSSTVTQHFVDLFRASDSLPEFLLELLRNYPLFPVAVMLDKEGDEIPSSARNAQQLADQALEIVHIMESHGIQKGDRVILVFFPSVEFLVALWACYLGGFVAVTVPPPIRLASDLLSFSGIVEKSQAKFVLSHNIYFNFSSLKTASHKVSSFLTPKRWWGKPKANETPEEDDDNISWPSLSWIYVDAPCARKESQIVYPTLLRAVSEYVSEVSGDDLAHLQMTSGSTACPKLVRVTHKAIILNVLLVCDKNHPVPKQRMLEPNYTRDSCPWTLSSNETRPPTREEYHRSVVLWIPHFHDFFIFHIPAALVYCCRLCVISPVDFLAKPLIWLKACQQHRASETCAPNFALDLAVAKSSEQDRQKLGISLQDWTTFVTQGGEPLCEKSFQRFSSAFPFIRSKYYINAFGMAEAVAGVCAAPLADKNSRTYIEKGMLSGETVHFLPADHPNARVCFSCGHTVMELVGRKKPGEFDNSRVIVVHKKTLEELPEGHIGEVWCCSPGYGTGYWGWSDKENKAQFAAVPTKRITAEEGRTFLRSGDRGFILNGHLFLVGRIKAVLILQGRNYEPSDIEYNVWGCHPNLRPGCTVALSVPNEDLGTDELILISEVRNEQLSQEEFEQTAFQMREALADGFSLVCPEILFFGAKKGVLKTTSGKPKRNAIMAKYLQNRWTPLHVSKEKVKAIVDPMEAPDEMLFPEGAEEKIAKIFHDLRPENDNTPAGVQNVLDETLSTFSVTSSEMVRIQNIINDEFGVYIPSGVLLRIDPGATTVRQLFAGHVFSQTQGERSPAHRTPVRNLEIRLDPNGTSPPLVHSPARKTRGRSASPGDISPNSRASSPKLDAANRSPSPLHNQSRPSPSSPGSFLVSTQSSAQLRETKKAEKKEGKKEKKKAKGKEKETLIPKAQSSPRNKRASEPHK